MEETKELQKEVKKTLGFKDYITPQGYKYSIYDDKNIKILKSEKYNSIFNKKTGMFLRWGETPQVDPKFSPVGCEILDIEVSTICHGINNQPCPWCYKSNFAVGENMSFETYKQIIDKMPLSLNQVALGIGSIDANPDLWKIMEYTREKGIVPNITINGARLTDEIVEKLVKYCGAVSVSCYSPKDVCYDAVKMLTDAGLKQVNIHQLIAHETVDKCLEVINDKLTDPRLEKLNAIVFLTLKPKGKRNTLTVPTMDDYRKVIKSAIDKKVGIGSDSCGSGALYRVYKELGLENMVKDVVESCESFGLFSSYINVKGEYFPCSFTENEGEWEQGIDVVNCEDFLSDVWFNEKLEKYRKASICSADCNGCRKCLTFKDVNIEV